MIGGQEDAGAAAAGQAVRKGRLTWDEVFERAKAYRQKVEAHAIKLEPAKEVRWSLIILCSVDFGSNFSSRFFVGCY